MNRIAVVSMISVALCGARGWSQGRTANDESASKDRIAPIYNVTVIDHGVDAVNYRYRSGPTKIDFRGTVLLSDAKGEATVESHRGRTQIDAKFENLLAPARFGREYLTYVLWALSPEGAPRNLGEIVADSSNRAKMTVTTELAAFGMIVTAEPYSTVQQPSDVVTLENRVRPDTVGKIEPIQAKYELLPRSHYTWQVPEAAGPEPANRRKVSMDRYEAILAVYQAQNAIGIARVAEADKYAPSALAKAERSLAEAQRLQARKANTRLVVQNAHEAAQTAEDARVISEQRKRDEELSGLRNRTEARPGSAPATARREPQTTSGPPESAAHK